MMVFIEKGRVVKRLGKDWVGIQNIALGLLVRGLKRKIEVKESENL